MRKNVVSLVRLLLQSLVVTVLSVLIIVRDGAPVFITDDSALYFRYAQTIIEGPFSEVSKADAIILRTPGYPLLLALGNIITGDPQRSVLFAHTLVAFVCNLIVVWTLRNFISWMLIGLALVLVQIEAGVFYLTALTEWACINLLLALFSSICAYRLRRRPAILLLISFISAFCILLRPSLVLLILLPFIADLGMHSKPFQRGVKMSIVALGFSPLLLFLIRNLALGREFLLSPLGSIALFGLATLFPQPTPIPNEPVELRQFVEALHNAGGFSIPHSDISSLSSREIEVWSNHAMWVTGEGARKALDWSYGQYGRGGAEYFWWVIRKNIPEYCQLVFQQFIASLRFLDYYFWLLLLLGSALALKTRKLSTSNPLIFGTFVMVAFHFAHMLLCVSMNPAIFRHFAVTYYPMLFSIFISIFMLVSGKTRKNYSLPNLAAGVRNRDIFT